MEVLAHLNDGIAVLEVYVIVEFDRLIERSRQWTSCSVVSAWSQLADECSSYAEL